MGPTESCEAFCYHRGYQHGQIAAAAVRANVSAFWAVMASNGDNPRRLSDKAIREQHLLPATIRAQMHGMADGSRTPYLDLLAYNLYQGHAFPDECTVMMAVGASSATGNTIFMKNSDQVGSDKMVGPNFDQFKEIYVVQVTQSQSGNRIVGLSAAGSTGIKVGVNDKGVAVGSNIARTTELAARNVDITQVRASDRTQLLREALEESTALAAAQRVMARVAEAPTSTPGNMEFADARECWILETSYKQAAMEVIRDAPASRANRFKVLEALNNPDDVSSVCRYVRTRQLVESHAHELSVDRFKEFSADHANGPGQNSICRHGDHYRDETSLGAAVIEIDRQQPQHSRIALCVGKPCHAWRNLDGWVELEAAAEVARVPTPFLDGSAWKRFYTEAPNLGR